MIDHDLYSSVDAKFKTGYGDVQIPGSVRTEEGYVGDYVGIWSAASTWVKYPEDGASEANPPPTTQA